LLIDGEVVDTKEYSDSDADATSLALQSAIIRFKRSITGEDLGSSLRLQARVTDFHQEVNQTDVLRISV